MQQENFYRHTVAAAGDGQLLRQAYVKAEGHCNFTPAEYIAGLHAVEYRINAGQSSQTKRRHKTKPRHKVKPGGKSAHKHKTKHQHKSKHHQKMKQRRKINHPRPKDLWGSVTTAKSLQAAALALHEGGAAFIPFNPGPLTGATVPSGAEVGPTAPGVLPNL